MIRALSGSPILSIDFLEDKRMRDAVIVSTARTPIGRAYRGAFNATPSPTLAAHAIRAAVERSGIDQNERSEEHPSALQSLMRSSYAIFCVTKPTTSYNKVRTRY